jgi:DNA-binding transcriptional LysR family regulator
MGLPDLDPDLLKAFVAVAEQRSFTRAARLLHRTQSAISMQIRRLEERLGVALFHRSTVAVELSAAGEGLLGYARRILALNAEAVARLRAQEISGVVRLGVMDDYGTLVLPSLLAAFTRSHPQVQVEMETGLTAAMPERLGTSFDLVIALHPQAHGEGEALRREQPVWAAGIGHDPHRQDPLPVALYPPGCLFRRWAMEALDEAGRPWRLAFVSQSLGAVAAIAAEGLAVTVVKSGICPPGLRRLGPGDGLPPLPVAELRLHRAPGLSRVGNLLAGHLAAALGTIPAGAAPLTPRAEAS